MTNVTEQAGKVATSTVEALKSTPSLLVVVLLNAIFMGFLFYIANGSRERQDKQFELIMSRCYAQSPPGAR